MGFVRVRSGKGCVPGYALDLCFVKKMIKAIFVEIQFFFLNARIFFRICSILAVHPESTFFPNEKAAIMFQTSASRVAHCCPTYSKSMGSFLVKASKTSKVEIKST